MSQKRRSSSRKRPTPPLSRQTNKTSILYIVIVSIMVFSLLIAGLATVDWGAFFPDSADPTPDYEVDQIALQQTVVAENPDDAEEQERLASMLANTGRTQEAISAYEEAVRLDPENGEIRRNFAMSLHHAGMPHDSEAQFLRAIEINPDDHIAHYYLARLYLEWNPVRQEEARDHFERVIEIAPHSFLAEQATGVLDTLGPATPQHYEVTPIASPTYGE